MTERPITRTEVEAVARQIVAEALMNLAQQLGASPEVATEKRGWIDTDPAYQLLDFPSPKALRDMVASGDLRVGKEVRDRRKQGSRIPRYQFHIEKCQQRLTELPERRK